MKRATEIIHQFVPTTLLNVPKNRTEPASRELYADEIREFKRDLEVFTGKAILDEEVRRQITLYNQARRLLRSISELRKQPQRAITGREFLALAKTFYSLPPERLISLYTDVYQQLKASAPQGTPRLRLLIAGSVMGDGDHRILDIVEGELGAAVVAEDHCAGVRPFYSNVPEDGDPYRALADGYLDQAPCSNRKPMEDAVKFTAHLAREYAVDGVLYIYLKFCSCYGLTKKGFIDGLQALGLPVLDISSDYSQSDHGQLKTRIEAFIEILNERKEPSYESAVQSA
jgi:benzoyl-CoA reductase/2-hydroxyglutaryl-CoA dehydratase subunit BcrC/BadD/HgdB